MRRVILSSDSLHDRSGRRDSFRQDHSMQVGYNNNNNIIIAIICILRSRAVDPDPRGKNWRRKKLKKSWKLLIIVILLKFKKQKPQCIEKKPAWSGSAKNECESTALLVFYVMFNATGNYYLLLMFTRSIMDQLGQTEVNNTDKQVFINHLFVASRERELG